MLIRLSNQTFKRRYGDFTYFFHRLDASDKMFRNAEVFCENIGREPIEFSVVRERVLKVFSDADVAVVSSDFEDFVRGLIAEGFVLAGKTPEELDAQERKFSYDVKDPKTLKLAEPISAETAEMLSQNVLGDWFEKNPTLFSLQLDITQACTERCRHCYIPEYNPLYLPYEKVCETLDEFRAMGGLEISLSGGECMLHPDFIKILKAARERDCVVSCLSNLTVCDDEKIRALREADSTVQVSLYSMTPNIHDTVTCLKGSWRRTIDAIIRLRAADIPVRISCPCLQINYEGYPEVLKFAESLKMSAQTDFIIIAKGDGDCSNLCNRLTLPQTREILRDVILKAVPMNSEYFSPDKKAYSDDPETWKKRKICGACVDSLCLAANGEYYPCPGFSGKVLGNCWHDSLADVWLRSPETLKIRSVSGADFPKCAICENRDYCSLCMCRNFNETGDIFTVPEHGCRVAALNREVVEEKHRQMLAAHNGQ